MAPVANTSAWLASTGVLYDRSLFLTGTAENVLKNKSDYQLSTEKIPLECCMTGLYSLVEQLGICKKQTSQTTSSVWLAFHWIV